MKKLKNIMLVDDNEADNVYHEIMINKVGVAENVIIYNDSRKALDFIISNYKGKENSVIPEIIFLDINMPAINGFEFIEKLLANNIEPNGRLKIVMLTGSLNPDDNKIVKEKYSRVVADYLNKPLTEDVIIALVEKLFAAEPLKEILL